MSKPADLRMIVFDVDGVLTDGSIYVDDNGVETKRFHVRDGMGIRAAMRSGLSVGVLSGRSSRAVVHRMAQLGVEHVLQGHHDKLIAFETLCQMAKIDPAQVAFVGDDLIDLPPMLHCGYPIAVAAAVEDVRAEARYVTRVPGGHAAARDAIEHLLKARGEWEAVVERYVV